MRTLIFTIAVLTSLSSFAQFTYDERGLTPKFTVNDVPEKTQKELYQKSLNWIKETYKNPEKVIKATIEYEKIRWEGVALDAMCHSALGMTYCYNTTYTIELVFKDGKFKFNPIAISYRIPGNQYAPSTTERIDFTTGQYYYNRKGKLKSRTATIPASVELLLNNLNNRLIDYITKDDAPEEW